MTEKRQVNEIRGIVLGDGSVRLQTGEFTQANHKSADDLVKFFEEHMGANPQRSKARQPRLKHQPKLPTSIQHQAP